MLFWILGLLTLGETPVTDYAEASQRDAWLRHPVYGDASFDAFERRPGNPVVRGVAPYEWPVNGSLFIDPRGGNWFLYVGRYCAGYAFNDAAPSLCTVYRSADQGAHWDEVGPALAWEGHVFEGEVSPLWHAPDASVIYADGRYHMSFDWTTKTTTWANAANPPPDANSGVGYAWAEQPEGPFHVTARPVASTREQPLLMGRYRRLYASSIHRRKSDWLVLTLTDSGPYFGWALLGMTSAQAEGPYSKPQLLLHPTSMRFHPPLMEFFPSFAHDGFLYAPATSVAANRNFQTVFRAPIEEAMRPEAWQIYQYGSVWHAEPVENEACGLWGQTFSGTVDSSGVLQALFPSRDAQGMGTINLATRPWNVPYREQGFVVSGHQGPSLVRLKREGPMKRIEVELAVKGTVRIVTEAKGPLGPERPRSDAVLHPLAYASLPGLELAEGGWAVWDRKDRLAQGSLAAKGVIHAAMTFDSDGSAEVQISDRPVWKGPFGFSKGPAAVFTAAHSHARVERFAVTGENRASSAEYSCTEALLGAAQNESDWEYRKSASFRNGFGAVSKGGRVEGKWNFEGRGCALYTPQGPEYGTAEIFVDGVLSAKVDFHAAEERASHEVFRKDDLAESFHALVIRSVEGRMPLDVLEVEF